MKTPTPAGVAKAPNTVKAPVVVVEVTAQIIAEGTRKDSGHCMIAEALKVAVPGARRVSVDLQTIRFTDPVRPVRYTYLTPRTGQVHLVNFDQGIDPEPFRFQLRSGAVTRAGSNSTVKARRSAEAKSVAEAARIPDDAAPEDKRVAAVSRARLSDRGRVDGSVPDRVGGETPPLAALASPAPKHGPRKGIRREFGLRSLSR